MPDFSKLIGEARSRDASLRAAKEEAVREAGRKAMRADREDREAETMRLELAEFWHKVAGAMLEKSPVPDPDSDIRIVTMEGANQLHKVWSKWGRKGNLIGNPKKHEAAKTRILSAHTIPAWNMRTGYSLPYIGHSDLYPHSLQPSPMYFGEDGRVHYKIGNPHNLAGATIPIYGQGKAVGPGVVIPDELGLTRAGDAKLIEAGRGIHRYEEIAVGLANLVAIHDLQIDI